MLGTTPTFLVHMKHVVWREQSGSATVNEEHETVNLIKAECGTVWWVNNDRRLL